jgi:predicted nucleic acid-binding protein
VNFLLDTNLISEWLRPRPDRGVVEWLAATDEDRVYISVVTMSEIRYGIERMTAGSRRKRIEDWLTTDLPRRFENRILPIDAVIADAWGKIMYRGQAVGRPVGPMDAYIAATAETRDLTLVTRNVSDFDTLRIPVISPWTTV